MSDDESTPTSLTNYLSQAYLPPLILDEDLPQVQHLAPKWPRIEELDMDRPRLIRLVSDIPLLALQNAVRTYYAAFEKRLKVDWKNTHLTLPSPGMTVLDRSKMSHLVVNDETGFLAALEYLILDTSAEALRTIERRQFDEDELSFTRICVSSARDTRRLWTVYSFGPQTPPTSILRPGIVVLALSPWTLGKGDLQEFSSRRQFHPSELEKDPLPPSKPWSNAMKVWAMLYDTCRVSGYRWFVVTTYNQWVFGTWSLEWSGAEVTEPIPFDKTRGMSVVEILTFWLECARDKSRYWHISADIPRGY